MVLNKNRKINLRAYLLFVFFASASFLFKVKSAHAIAPLLLLALGAAGGSMIAAETANIFVAGAKVLLYAIFQMLGWLTSVAIIIFEWATKPEYMSGPTGFFNDPGIYAMWKFVRDFFNLFFILTLLYIAFTIVFQVAGDYKKTILSIVLAALFINFSFPVTRFMIDAVNVPMYFFANEIGGENSKTGKLGNIMSATDIKEILIPQKSKLSQLTVTHLLAANIFLFIFTISLLVLAILYVIRFAALLILLIFSSVGFAAGVVPALSKYSTMWWDKFWQYALFGPVAMLMVFVATRVFSVIANGQIQQQVNVLSQNYSVGELSPLLAAMAMFSVPMVILWMSITVANSMSIAGAGSITGMATGFLKGAGKMPFKGAWMGAKFGGRKYEKWVAGKGGAAKYLAPSVLVGAWKNWREESAHQDHAPVERAAAAVQDRLNALYGDHTDHAYEVARKQSSEAEKHMTSTSNDEDYISHEVLNAIDPKKRQEVAGGLLALAKGNGLNTFILQAAKDDRYKDLLKKDDQGNAEVSSENLRTLLKQIMIDSGETDEQMIAKQLMAISEAATASGNYAFGGMAVYDGHGGFKIAQKYKKGVDPNTGEDIWGDQQADWAAGKVKNLESQERQRKIHPDSLFTRTDKGFGDLNGEVAKAVISTLTYADVTQIDRSRDDLKEAIHQAYSKGDPTSEFMKLFNSNDIFKQYVMSAVQLKRGLKKDEKVSAEWLAANGPGTKYVGSSTSSSSTTGSGTGNPNPASTEKTPKEQFEEMKKKRKERGAKY